MRFIFLFFALFLAAFASRLDAAHCHETIGLPAAAPQSIDRGLGRDAIANQARLILPAFSPKQLAQISQKTTQNCRAKNCGNGHGCCVNAALIAPIDRAAKTERNGAIAYIDIPRRISQKTGIFRPPRRNLYS